MATVDETAFLAIKGMDNAEGAVTATTLKWEIGRSKGISKKEVVAIGLTGEGQPICCQRQLGEPEACSPNAVEPELAMGREILPEKLKIGVVEVQKVLSGGSLAVGNSSSVHR